MFKIGDIIWYDIGVKPQHQSIIYEVLTLIEDLPQTVKIAKLPEDFDGWAAIGEVRRLTAYRHNARKISNGQRAGHPLTKIFK